MAAPAAMHWKMSVRSLLRCLQENLMGWNLLCVHGPGGVCVCMQGVCWMESGRVQVGCVCAPAVRMAGIPLSAWACLGRCMGLAAWGWISACRAARLLVSPRADDDLSVFIIASTELHAVDVSGCQKLVLVRRAEVRVLGNDLRGRDAQQASVLSSP